MHTLFGEKLRSERKKLGLSTEAFAKMCGTSRSYITLIENGKRLPGKQLLPKIANALEIKIVVVLNWYLENIAKNLHKDIDTA